MVGKSEAEGEKEACDAEEVDLSVRVVKENENWNGVKRKENHTTETGVHLAPVVAHQGEGSQAHEEGVQEGEGNSEENEVLVRLEEVRGLEREDSGAVFIEVLFLGRVVNPYSWKILAGSAGLIIESGKQNSLRNKVASDVGAEEHVEVAAIGRVVQVEVEVGVNAVVSVPLLVREGACGFLPPTVELIILAVIEGHVIPVLPLDQTQEYQLAKEHQN